MKEKEIIDEARAWIGTRWMHGTALKGYATDCIGFIVEISRTFGWIPENYKAPKYSRDWALHNSDSLLLPEIEKFCIKISITDLKVGDILLFKYGLTTSHAGIYIGDGRMIHAHIRSGVQETFVGAFRDKLHSAWRYKVLNG